MKNYVLSLNPLFFIFNSFSMQEWLIFLSTFHRFSQLPFRFVILLPQRVDFHFLVFKLVIFPYLLGCLISIFIFLMFQVNLWQLIIHSLFQNSSIPHFLINELTILMLIFGVWFLIDPLTYLRNVNVMFSSFLTN